MWLKRDRERDLRSLLSRIEAAPVPRRDVVADLLRYACPRLSAAIEPAVLVPRFVEAEAWVDLGFWLINWELPDWVIHRLSCDDSRWNCAICVRGLAINWADDVAEFQHDHPALAIFGALTQAQLRKMRGHAPSNVTPFRRAAGALSHSLIQEVKR